MMSTEIPVGDLLPTTVGWVDMPTQLIELSVSLHCLPVPEGGSDDPSR